MQRTDIEYLTHVWNFYTGCKNQENGVCALPCWAKALAHRFGRSFEPTLHIEKLREAIKIRGDNRVGVCFTGDLGGVWVKPELLVKEPFIHYDFMKLKDMVFQCVSHNWHTQYFFLTKCPWNFKGWGRFPDNAWVGTSVTNMSQFSNIQTLNEVDCKHRWVSFEPLLDFTPPDLRGIDWVVIGGQTQPTKMPRLSWVQGILTAAHNDRNIPVFIKNNLKLLLGEEWPGWKTRQELPC